MKKLILVSEALDFGANVRHHAGCGVRFNFAKISLRGA